MNPAWRAFLFSGCAMLCAATPGQAQQADPVMMGLVENVRRGEAAEADLRRVRDQQLEDLRARNLTPAQRDAKIRNVLEVYRQESSQLVAQYRQPLIEELQRRNPGLKDSMGTSLYLEDATGARQIGPDGKPVLNPDFRGWSGDHDLQGPPAAVQRVRNTLAQHDIAMTGAGSADLKTLNPGDLSADALEMTINLDPTDQHWRDEIARLDKALESETDPAARAKLVTMRDRSERAMWSARQADSMLRPGDSAHQGVAQVAAASKETYVSASMAQNQIGRQAVAVNDHYKKAVSGFALDGEALMNPANENAFQGMVKGTGKALKEANLSDAVLKDALSRNGLLMAPDQYRKILDDIKKNPVPDLYGMNAQTMEAFRNVNAAVMDEALRASGDRARQDLTARRTQLSDLDSRIAQASGDERTRLAAEREQLGREYVDSQVKLQEVENANAARRTQYGLAEGPRQTRPVAANVAADLPSSSATGGAALRAGAMRALDGAGKLADFYEYATTTFDEAEKVVSEAKPEDSDAELVARVTYRASMRVTGMTDALEMSFTDEDFQALNTSMNEGNYGSALFQWGAMTSRTMFYWAAAKLDETVYTPVENTLAAGKELLLLGGAVVGEAGNYLRNVSEQEAQNIGIAMRRAQAARETATLEDLDAPSSTPPVALVSLLDGDVDVPAGDSVDTPPVLASLPEPPAPAETPSQAVPAPTEMAALSPPPPVTRPAANLSTIAIRHEIYTGPEVAGALTPGSVIALTTEWAGSPPQVGEAEWLIDGVSRKKRALSEDNALGLRLDTTGMQPGTYAVSVQVSDGAAVVSHAMRPLILTDPAALRTTLGAIAGHLDTYDGPPLAGPIENGQIVAFNLPVTVPNAGAGGTVLWQVYGPDGAAIAALAKEEAVTTATVAGFRFQPEGLGPGAHEVRASFMPADQGQAVQVVNASFAVAVQQVEAAQTAQKKQSTAQSVATASPPSSGTKGVRWLRRMADPKAAKDPNKVYWTVDGHHLIVEAFLHGGGEGVLVHDDAGKPVSVLGDADNEAYACIGHASSPDKLMCKDRKSAGRPRAEYHMTVYSLSDGARLQHATGLPGWDVVFSPNGQRMAVAGYQPNADGRRIIDLTLLDAATGGEIGRVDDFSPSRTGLPIDGYQNDKDAMFSGDGKVLIVLDEQEDDSGRITRVHLLDGLTGSPRNTVPGNRFGSFFRTVSSDGRYAFLSSERQDHSGFFELVDLAGASVLWTVDDSEERGQVFSTDGRFLHSLMRIGENDITGRYEIRTRDVATGNIVQTRTVPMSALLEIGDRTFDTIEQIVLHPDGQRIAVEAKLNNKGGRIYVFGVLE